MNEWKQARESYEAAPIPEELGERVQEGIRQGRKRYLSARRPAWRAVASLAACLVVLLAALNMFPAFGGGGRRGAGAGRSIPGADSPKFYR